MDPGEMAGMMMMDLYIETLTGTAFELRVSPFETVLSVKTKIYRLEGIPMSQQYLIWNERELADDLSLHECAIPSGATLRLVLGMRGGPINTRRVPLDLPCDVPGSSSSANSLTDLFPQADGPATFLVFRDGDQLNFFQVVDRGDGTLSPLAESVASSLPTRCPDDTDELAADADTSEAGGNVSGDSGEDMQRRLRLVQLKLDQMRLNRRTSRLLPPIEGATGAPPLANRSLSYDPSQRPPRHPGVSPGSAQAKLGRSGARLPATLPATLSATMPATLPSSPPITSSASIAAPASGSRHCPELIQIGSSRLTALSMLLPPSRHSPLLNRRETLPPVEVAGKAVGSSGDKAKRKKRCFQCHKKTGLVTSYQCRCGNNFCSKHRYAEVHSCPYDYKAEGRRLIQESNPVVAASKLPKI